MAVERITGQSAIRAAYGDYLRDESRMEAEGIEELVFVHSTEETAEVMREWSAAGRRVCLSGARTGIAGGAVPIGSDVVLSTEKIVPPVRVGYDVSQDAWFARVGAGTRLNELDHILRKRSFTLLDEALHERMQRLRFFYPVDPTEMTASVGGTVATNASGARTFGYGPTRDWVRALTLVLADGDVLDVRRGEVVEQDGTLRATTRAGRTLEIPVEDIGLPATKNTTGYHLARGIDLVDLVVGSEGTLGVVTEVELRVIPDLGNTLYLVMFLEDDSAVVPMVEQIRRGRLMKPLSIEYFDPESLNLLRRRRRELGWSSHVPPFPDSIASALYIEVPFRNEQHLDDIYEHLQSLMQRHDCSTTWAEFDAKGLEAIKLFRHQLPESVNTIIGRRKRDVPELHKVGTDMAVPDEHLATILDIYRRELDRSGLEHVIFGHIGNNHVHVNILPRTADELAEAKTLYLLFAREVVKLGGSVSAEHGVGRIKRGMVSIQYDAERLEAMRRVKRCFDPGGLLNRGVLLDD